MEDISLDLAINDESLGDLPPPAPARASAMSPVRETQIEKKHEIPGPKNIVLDFDGTEKSQRIVTLLIDLFVYVLQRGLHLLVKPDATTKRKWSCALEQLHNHLLHQNEWPGLSPAFTPLEPYRMWTGKNPQYKLRELINKASEHFSERFDAKQAAQGMSYVPDRREELGKQIFSERANAIIAKRSIYCQEGSKGQGTYRE